MSSTSPRWAQHLLGQLCRRDRGQALGKATQACQQQEADKHSVVPLPPFPLSTHLEVSLGKKAAKEKRCFMWCAVADLQMKS